MMRNLYRALTAAGAGSDDAEAAASEAGALFTKMTRIEVLIGASLALQIAVFVKLFTS